jgi:hypothetical protein
LNQKILLGTFLSNAQKQIVINKGICQKGHSHHLEKSGSDLFHSFIHRSACLEMESKLSVNSKSSATKKRPTPPVVDWQSTITRKRRGTLENCLFGWKVWNAVDQPCHKYYKCTLKADIGPFKKDDVVDVIQLNWEDGYITIEKGTNAWRGQLSWGIFGLQKDEARTKELEACPPKKTSISNHYNFRRASSNKSRSIS